VTRNQIASDAQALAGDSAPTGRSAAPLAVGSRLGPFEVIRLIALSAGTATYLATDHALGIRVALQEYLPARLMRRDADHSLRALDPAHDQAIARGRHAFIEETRLLARCDHPSLARISQLFEANGTSYRVMPYYDGQPLGEVRRGMGAAPDEAALRALLDDLLGALATLHDSGHVHGGVGPVNILLLADDHPLLLGPGAADREVGDGLVASLMQGVKPSADHPPDGHAEVAAVPLSDPRGDLYALAEVIRFCITGTMPVAGSAPGQRELLTTAIAKAFEPASRPRYSATFISAIDAASSPFVQDWPANAAQFKDWLAVGAPRRSRPIDLSPIPTAVSESMIRRPAPAARRNAGASRSGRRWWWLVGALSLLGAAAIAFRMQPWLASPTPRIERPPVTGQVIVVPPEVTKPPPSVGPTVREAPAAVGAAAPQTPAPTPPAPRPRADRPAPRAAAPDIATQEGATDPRAACAPRTEFALYRCMKTQCNTPQWAAHPQCIRLNELDSIE
jgi:serine/threonine protein kinase